MGEAAQRSPPSFAALRSVQRSGISHSFTLRPIYWRQSDNGVGHNYLGFVENPTSHHTTHLHSTEPIANL